MEVPQQKSDVKYKEKKRGKWPNEDFLPIRSSCKYT